MLVDRAAHRRNAPEDLQQQSHYGQLHCIFALPLRPRTPLKPTSKAHTLLLALILGAKATREDTYDFSVVWYGGNLSTGEIVDANTVQCAVGRVRDRKRWWIIDRSSDLAYPVFV